MECELTSYESSLVALWHNTSVTLFAGSFGGMILADRMMWFQYIADEDSAAEQAEALSIRTSVRRMSSAIILLENENNQGAAVVPQEQGSSAETAGLPQASNGTDNAADSKVGKGMPLFASFGNCVTVGVIAVGYPIAVLPYYRADSTTE